MPHRLDPSAWRPVGVDELDAISLRIVQSGGHCLATAGPGSGKTELLAQRALFLLQTGRLPGTRRILALTFKKDAAANLRERVRERCGQELGLRFDSHTYDSFAKEIVEQFRQALPAEIRPPHRFSLATRAEHYRRIDNRIDAALRELRLEADPAVLPSMPRPGNNPAQQRFLTSLQRGDFLDLGRATAIGQAREGLAAEGNTPFAAALRWATVPVWAAVLAADDCIITFDMLKRLAERLVSLNPLICRALQTTYAYVLLDEFQDTTPLQYELLHRSFDGPNVAMTAVGDHRQRIMGWAGAMAAAGERFCADRPAQREELLINHRSDVNLVRIQHALVATLDQTATPAVASPTNTRGVGRAEVRTFESDVEEAVALAGYVDSRLAASVAPRDIAVLTRTKPEQYCELLRTELLHRGINSRFEEPYLELLRDELVQALVRALELFATPRAPDAFQYVCDLVCSFGLARESAVGERSASARIQRVEPALRQRLSRAPASLRDVRETVREVLQRLLGGRDVVRANFPHCYNDADYQVILGSFCDIAWQAFSDGASGWANALNFIQGKNTIPVMTIHKSKGLQFDTVLILGLEDHAWARFGPLSHEERCAFFVGFSRAKKQIIISSVTSRTLGGESLTMSIDRVGPLLDLTRRAAAAAHSD